MASVVTAAGGDVAGDGRAGGLLDGDHVVRRWRYTWDGNGGTTATASWAWLLGVLKESSARVVEDRLVLANMFSASRDRQPPLHQRNHSNQSKPCYIIS